MGGNSIGCSRESLFAQAPPICSRRTNIHCHHGYSRFKSTPTSPQSPAKVSNRTLWRLPPYQCHRGWTPSPNNGTYSPIAASTRTQIPRRIQLDILQTLDLTKYGVGRTPRRFSKRPVEHGDFSHIYIFGQPTHAKTSIQTAEEGSIMRRLSGTQGQGELCGAILFRGWVRAVQLRAMAVQLAPSPPLHRKSSLISFMSGWTEEIGCR